MTYRKVKAGEVQKGVEGRVRVVGRVAEAFTSPKNDYKFLTLEDESGIVRIKAFREQMARIGGISKESYVDVFGTVKEFRGEKYIVPDIVKKVDANFAQMRGSEIQAEPEQAAADLPEAKRKASAAVRRLDKGNGAPYEDIKRELGIDDEKLKAALAELLHSGELFEPTYGKYKLI